MAIADDIRTQWRTGGAVKRLLFINLGVFLAVHAVGLIAWGAGGGSYDDRVLRWLMATNDWPALLRRPWTVVTYMFTHFDPFHLFWNMLMFWFSGRLFEDLLGAKRMTGMYLLGGLAGFAFYALATLMPAHMGLGGTSMILGASAAVMAVFIGIATYHPDMEVGLLFIGGVRLKWVALVVFALDLISIRQGGNTGGHLAHIGGAVYGYLSATALKRGRGDWNMVFANALERIGDLFGGKKRTRLRVEKRPVRRGVLADVDFNSAKRDKQARVDAILDKISRSGYDSLSKEERDFLFHASKD